jgi:hypothetical protein
MLLTHLFAALNIDPAAEGHKATFQWATPEDEAGASSSAALEVGDSTVTFNVSERFDDAPHPSISGTAVRDGDAVIFAGDAGEDAFEQFREAVRCMSRVA